jgi:hypothetical protein
LNTNCHDADSANRADGSGAPGQIRVIGEIGVRPFVFVEHQLPWRRFRESRGCFWSGVADPRDWRDQRSAVFFV